MFKTLRSAANTCLALVVISVVMAISFPDCAVIFGIIAFVSFIVMLAMIVTSPEEKEKL